VANAFFTRPMTALKRALSRLRKVKKRLIVPLLLAAGWASVPEIDQVPAVVLGEPSFFPTIAAHTDAPIVGGNRVDLLFNGEQIFPAMRICEINIATNLGRSFAGVRDQHPPTGGHNEKQVNP
jgi:hypothetical protein